MNKHAFRHFLKERGLRFTKERQLILNAVLNQNGHFDPEELFIALRNVGYKVSRASVYRTLPLMVEADILQQVEWTDKQAHYECIVDRRHHDHMLCLSCGRIVEFHCQDIENLQDQLCQQKGFEKIDHSLEIVGYCSKCRRSQG